MATKTQAVVEVGEGLSARWNGHVSSIPAHIALTNEYGRLIGRVFADSQAEAWEKLPDRVEKIQADRKAAVVAEIQEVEEDEATVSAAQDAAIKRILARRNPAPDAAAAAKAAAEAKAAADKAAAEKNGN